MPLTQQQIDDLDAASARIAAGNPGAATDTNAGDVANVAHAAAEFGYSWTPPATGGDPDPTLQQQFSDYQTQFPTQDYSAQMTAAQEFLAAQKAALEAARQATISGLETREAEAVRRSTDIAGRGAGSMRRILGRAGGFTTTAGGAAMEAQNARLGEEVARLGMAKSDAIASANAAFAQGNAEAAGQAFNQMFQITQAIEKQQQDQISNFIKMQKEQRAERGFEWDTEQALFDMMEDMEAGTTREVADPRTGEMITIIGTGSPEVYMANKNGVVTALNKKTGETLWTSYLAGGANADASIDPTGTKFNAAAQKGINQLQKGEPWGTVWNRLKQQFPDMENRFLDVALGGSVAPGAGQMSFAEGESPYTGWATPGAYEEWKGSQYKPDVEGSMESQVWAWLSSSPTHADGTPYSRQEKNQQIMEFGLNPEDFGY